MNGSTAPIVRIVDDDASFLTAVARLLRASGFAVKLPNFSPNRSWTSPDASWSICRCLV